MTKCKPGAGLAPNRRQAITWTSIGILWIGLLGTNFSEIWIRISSFSFNKMHLKMSSARCDMAFIEPMHRNKPNITYCQYCGHFIQGEDGLSFHLVPNAKKPEELYFGMLLGDFHPKLNMIFLSIFFSAILLKSVLYFYPFLFSLVLILC